MKKGFIVLFSILGLLVLFFSWRSCQTDNSSNDSELQIHDSIEDMMKEIKAHWNVSKSIDEMTDKEVVTAIAYSSNKAQFDFPYDGGSILRMYVRKIENKLDVFFYISKGQFDCNSYTGTDKITIRFGEEPAISYKACESATHDSQYIFIAKSSDARAILEKCKSAKDIKVQVSFFSQGSRVFNFNVEEPLSLD